MCSIKKVVLMIYNKYFKYEILIYIYIYIYSHFISTLQYILSNVLLKYELLNILSR